MRANKWQSHILLACLAISAVGSQVFAGDMDPRKARPSPDGKTLWYDCKDLDVEGKGWTDTQAFYDRLPAKAEGKVTPSVWGLSHHQRRAVCPVFVQCTDYPGPLDAVVQRRSEPAPHACHGRQWGRPL